MLTPSACCAKLTTGKEISPAPNNQKPQSITMNFTTIKNSFDSIYRAICIGGETTPIQRRNLETLRAELSDLQDSALEDGDTLRWEECFNLTEAIDGLLGVDYSAETTCYV